MSIDGNKIMNVAAAKVLYDDLRQHVNNKLENDLKGAANGLAELDANGKVPVNQLPSYVDDVIEFSSLNSFPITGESGKIYIALDTNLTYRWSGSTYTEISSSLALGETENTAYRGDRGVVAYNHATNKGNAYSKGLYKITTNAEGHVTNVQNVIKQDITNLGIPGTAPTKVSQLQNDSGFISSYTETDPTVPNWAKTAEKPVYTATEVGALPDTTIIPSKVSDLTNDAGYLTQHQDISGKADIEDIPTKVSQLQNDSGFITTYTETDPTVPNWAKSPTKPTYTAKEVGALPSNTIIPTKVSDLQNDSGFLTQHQDISNKADKSEIPTKVSDLQNDAGYLTSHQDISGKANVSDIPTKVSDLTNDVGFISSYTETDPTVPLWAKSATKPLYTAQEVGALPSDTAIPTKTSDLTNDSGFITSYTETDPTVPAWAKAENKPSYTAQEVGALPNSTVIPTKVSDLINDAGYLTEHQSLSNYVQKTEYATASNPGIVKADSTISAIGIDGNGNLYVSTTTEAAIKAGISNIRPVFLHQQHISAFYGLAKAAGDTTQSQSSNAVGTYTDDAKSAIRTMLGVPSTSDIPLVPVNDVKINGTSIVSNGEADIPVAGHTTLGAVCVGSTGDEGISMWGVSKRIYIQKATDGNIITGIEQYKPIVPMNQHMAAFYGLAKAAGDTTQAESSNAVGTYTDNAKNAIKTMLDVGTITDTVSGTTPAITAVANYHYICGEVTSLSFTPCAIGICDVRFISGSTVAVLTVPNTVKWPEWFDPTSLEANTVYEISIEDGVYGVVATWPI